VLRDVEVLRMGGKSWDDTNTNVYLDVGLDCQDGGGEVRQGGGRFRWRGQGRGSGLRGRESRSTGLSMAELGWRLPVEVLQGLQPQFQAQQGRAKLKLSSHAGLPHSFQ
jgi:hypothetical protein